MIILVCSLCASTTLGQARDGLSTPSVPGSSSAAGAAPNLLLVTVDTLRADHLGSYGYAGVETPHLDRLAGEGVRFDQVATTNPLTLPAHASLLTGRYPFRHGVRDNLNFQLAPGELTLAEVLQAAGYATGAFLAASVLDLRTGLGQGFTTYADPAGSVLPARSRTPLQVERRGGEVARQAISWIAEQAGPFFAWVHLFDPHAPYAPPAPFHERYASNPYDGEIAYVDDVVGQLMAGLVDLGLDGTTLVVMTSDHGEGLGDHREQLHSLLIYDSTVRVPLILWAPGRLPAAVVANGQASIVDVMPTTLSILGIGDPEAASRDGVDLRSRIDAPDTPGEPAYIESMMPLLQFGWSELRALRGDGIKYIAAPRARLYDVHADPGETIDLIDQHADAAGAFGARLDEIAAGDDVGDLAFGERFADPEEEAVMRNLQALGYVTAATPRARPQRADPNDDIEMLEAFQRDSLATERALAGGNWSEAERALEALAARLPDHPMVHFYRGRVRLGQGRPDDAVDALEQAIALAVVNTAAWLDIAEAHRAAGEVPRSYDVLRSAEGIFPTLAVFPLRRGYYLQLDGRYRDAEEAYLIARELAPRNPTVWRRIADLYLSRRELDQAGAALRELVSLEPRAADAWSALGEVLLQQGEVDEAVAMFHEALRHDRAQRAAIDALRRLGIRND